MQTVTPELAAGLHVLRLQCHETANDLDWFDVVSAVPLQILDAPV